MGSFQIACWPYLKGNPYQALFYAALKPWGVEVTCPPLIDDAWLRRAASGLDALHLHWPDDLWRTRGRSWLARLHGVAGLERFLRLARRLGLKLIWTVHNLEPHEAPDWIDRLGYARLMRHCDLLIAHSRATSEQLVASHRPRGRVVTMFLGNYGTPSHTTPNPNEVRRQLGLDPHRPLLCCIGNLRQYKGVDLAVEAVLGTSQDVQLVIAGPPHPAFDLAGLSAACEGTSQVALIPRRLSDGEFAGLVSASTAVLLPYRKITGSSALLSALTFGRSVIVSDLPYFREICEPEPAAATFFPPGDSAGLARAIQRHLALPEERRFAAAGRLRDLYDWDRCIRPVAEVLQGWMPPTSDP